MIVLKKHQIKVIIPNVKNNIISLWIGYMIMMFLF